MAGRCPQPLFRLVRRWAVAVVALRSSGSQCYHLPSQFLLIFRKAAAGELQEDSGLHALARLSEIDVSTEGVKGAKNFFEAKVRQGSGGPIARWRCTRTVWCWVGRRRRCWGG